MKYFKILLFLIPYAVLAHIPDYTPLLKRLYFSTEIIFEDLKYHLQGFMRKKSAPIRGYFP